MTIEEMKNLTGGCLKSPSDPRNYKYSAVCGNASVTASGDPIEYPKSFRLWTSGVKNQGTKGTCVAHALCTMKETQDYYDSKSTQKYSTAWIYLIRDLDDYKGSGMYISQALKNLKNRGVVPFSMLGENIEYSEDRLIGYTNRNDPEKVEEAMKHRISAYAMTEDPEEIKHSLFVNHSPVVIMVNVFDSFYNTGADGIVKVPKPDKENYCGSHAMVIIGWTSMNGKEYWVVQNSWSDSWGDNGFCYLNTTSFPIEEKWTCIDIEDYPCNLTDINGRWSQDVIEKCVRAGIISGFEDGTFHPSENLTREQFCSAIWKLLEKVTK